MEKNGKIPVVLVLFSFFMDFAAWRRQPDRASSIFPSPSKY